MEFQEHFSVPNEGLEAHRQLLEFVMRRVYCGGDGLDSHSGPRVGEHSRLRHKMLIELRNRIDYVRVWRMRRSTCSLLGLEFIFL